MPTPEVILNQVNRLTADLIRVSLCDKHQFPLIKRFPGGIAEVTFPNSGNLSIVLKNIPYKILYEELVKAKDYNFMLADGALIQMMYTFDKDGVRKHRLAFFPSPDLETFQNDPEIYLTDVLYAEVVAKNIVPFPIRFDYDKDELAVKLIHHPYSHLTLGQYKNCRIPVTSPLTPHMFIGFVLRSFYNSAYKDYAPGLTDFKDSFPECIASKERDIIHIKSPSW